MMKKRTMRTTLPPLHALQAFVVIAQLGSMTRAAGRLHISQSALSRQVQQLEEFYGCPLFVRQHRGLSLTAEGAELLPSVEEAFAALVQVTSRIRKASGVLTLQLPPTLALRWFLPLLPKLNADLPGLEVRLATNWAPRPDFSTSDVDAIVAHGTGGWGNLVEIPLMREMLTPMCSPAMAAQLKEPADLRGVRLLHGSPSNAEWATWIAGVAECGLRADSGQVFDTLEMSLSAATRGLGVCVADPAMMREFLDAGMLVAPLAQRVPSGNTYFLTYPVQRTEQRKLQLLQAWLVGQFAAAGSQAVAASGVQ
jgi:LysR family transcriptional regulator, glycine cleavage system transcriptional activator